uniref:Uncharacterized protein n=1 Tax=Arsenophonus endosymbiont of Trialeurodes vaporariorum TaxID=235567 RepID=A0A3B0MMU4_9GAMM
MFIFDVSAISLLISALIFSISTSCNAFTFSLIFPPIRDVSGGFPLPVITLQHQRGYISIQDNNLQHKNYQPPIERLAIVIRDTLEVAENMIFIGRENLANQDFNAPVISIEQSGSSEVKGFSEKYRRNVEVMEYS